MINKLYKNEFPQLASRSKRTLAFMGINVRLIMMDIVLCAVIFNIFKAWWLALLLFLVVNMIFIIGLKVKNLGTFYKTIKISPMLNRWYGSE